MSHPDEPNDQDRRTVAWNPDDLPDRGADAGGTVAFDPADVERMKAETAAAEAEAPATSEDDPLVGRLLRDKWRVLKRLGAGSFGTVYKVRDEAGGWIEALKILGVDRLVGAEAENMRKRFLREAQIMKRLGTESKHIVGLSTYEEDIEAGLIYFLMEYVEGRPLSAAVSQEGPFAVERVVRLALQICDALIAAHEGPEPVVHRDLKLENVMLATDRDGKEIVKVLDFGIAKIAEKETDVRLTTAGTLGTPGYAAPEQLRAEPVDARTDLFAFGVILYALLTGRDPWLGGLAHVATEQIYELMVATDRGEVRPMEDSGVDVPPAMRAVVLKLLRRDPAQRFQSARELQDALRRIQEGGAAADVASLRVLTDPAGIEVEVRSGRSVVAHGPTPCLANGVEPGTYTVRLNDARYESVDARIELGPGALEDVTLVATAKSERSAARRRAPALAAAAVVVVAAALAVLVQPWGRSLSEADLVALASDGGVERVWISDVGIEGSRSVFGIPSPFRVAMDETEWPAAVTALREVGVAVDTRWAVHRLEAMAAEAQAEFRYFSEDGDDVRTIARRLEALEPGSRVARSLMLKVGERLAWDAAAAREASQPERAEVLLDACLDLVPAHPRCAALRGA